MTPHNRKGDASNPQAESGLLASQHAPQRETAKPPEKSREPTTNQHSGLITPEQIVKDLKAIIQGLEEEGVESSWMAAAHTLVACVERAAKERKPKQTMELVSERLSSIEKILMARQPGPQAASRGTWAEIAAGGVRQTGEPKATSLNRHTVRITMAKAEGMDNQEILKEVKKTIPGAAAIRKLHSGDIDVTVPDVATKDRAQGILPTECIRIHKKDYLVEVTGVPLTLQVAGGAQANNNTLATEICEASRSLTPGLKPKRLASIHPSTRSVPSVPLRMANANGKTHSPALPKIRKKPARTTMRHRETRRDPIETRCRSACGSLASQLRGARTVQGGKGNTRGGHSGVRSARRGRELGLILYDCHRKGWKGAIKERMTAA